MTPLEVLVAARELIAEPEHWTKGASARGKSGAKVDPDGRAAVSFCATGACYRATRRDWRHAPAAIDALQDAVNYSGIVYYNDEPTTTHTDILAVFDKAIANKTAAQVQS